MFQVAETAPAAAQLGWLEQRYERIEAEYAELVRRQRRGEALNAEMRDRLDAQVRQLEQANRMLKHQLDLALLKLASLEGLDHADEAQLRSFQATIGELRQDKATLAAVSERQQLELDAQQLTLDEQRKHIYILDKVRNGLSFNCSSAVFSLPLLSDVTRSLCF